MAAASTRCGGLLGIIAVIFVLLTPQVISLPVAEADADPDVLVVCFT